ncbi:hypothetical protein GJAV_G00093450 [Gymnothorax javanicus]|nr:hypothetical protein GJAV_G00093450 [Gymnothorax javanicus]
MDSTHLTGSGADTSLDDSSHDFDCPICQDVFKTPIRTKTCQHVFCRSCFETAVKSQGQYCPMCRGPVSDREKKAPDIRQQMRETRGQCRACGHWTFFSKMRTHYKSCQAYLDEYGPPVDSRIAPTAQNRGNSGAQTVTPFRISPALQVQQSYLTGGVTATYSCPYCPLQNLSDMALVQHCVTSHTGDRTPVVCPICAATSWGIPSYCSRNFIGHLRRRHRYSHGIYMNVHEDEDTQLHLAIQHSILQMTQRTISA